MMIKQVVGKCLIFAGVFMLACVIMGGGQADAGCGTRECTINCGGKQEPCDGYSCGNTGLLTCWNCQCLPGENYDVKTRKRWCNCL
jgi:hypothetical protein